MHSFTEEEFLEAIRTSTSHAQASIKLGYKCGMSVKAECHNRSKYRYYFHRLKPDVSHFTLFSRGCTKTNYSIFQCQYNFERKRSPKRNHSFDLTLEEFEKFLTNPCFYCGSTGKSKLKGHEDVLVCGIDRIKNNIGYTKDNCVSCCNECNKMKHSKDLDWWLLKVKQIYEHLDLSDGNLKKYEKGDLNE